MKKETARHLNTVVWLVIIVVLMGSAYHAWSQWGSYTLGSFLASLVVHAAPCALVGLMIDEAIVKHYDNK